MKFTLSGNHLNSTYADENGRVIYKVYTPGTLLSGSSTTVSKLLPDDIPRREDESGRGNEGDRFAHLGRVEWKSQHFFLRGEAISTEKFFGSDGWNPIFIVRGKRYKWISGSCYSKLQLDDGSKTQVARFHQEITKGIFGGEKKPAVLEIFSAGESMVDLIMMTLIYAEKERREGFK